MFQNEQRATWCIRENVAFRGFPFVAVAEVTDEASGGQLTGQVSELSAYGCYIDLLNSLPVESSLTVKIFAASRCFEAKANVIYAHQYI